MAQELSQAPSRKLTFIIIGQIILLAIIIVLVLDLRSGITITRPGPEAATESLAVADMLYSQELYRAAAAEYENVLTNYTFPPDKAANIAFKAADIYLSKLGQYQEALALLLKAERFDAQGRLAKSISEKKVESLERMKRTSDAQRVLEETAMLDTAKMDRADATAVVAEIGPKQITVRQLDHYISLLPEEMRKAMSTREKKIEFLQQLVATELIHNAALRKGYGRDPAVVEMIQQYEKNIMVQKYISEELSDKVQMTPTDMQLYYEANKARYDQKPLTEVYEQVGRDFQQAKYQEALALLFERLSAAENVTLNPHNITD